MDWPARNSSGRGFSPWRRRSRTERSWFPPCGSNRVHCWCRRGCFRVRRAKPATAAAAPTARAPESAVGEDQDVELIVQPAGVERGGIDHLKGELVLLENPARPAGRHDAAVLVV